MGVPKSFLACVTRHGFLRLLVADVADTQTCFSVPNRRALGPRQNALGARDERKELLELRFSGRGASWEPFGEPFLREHGAIERLPPEGADGGFLDYDGSSIWHLLIRG